MPYQMDIELTEDQKAEMAHIPPDAWFTSVDFRNASSPRHPVMASRRREARHETKRQLMVPWIRDRVEGKRVLDLFCANGIFSVEAALAGAREVVGIDFSAERVRCARFLASTLDSRVDCSFDFAAGDIYDLPNLVSGPFDVVLVLGGLYHIADPPYVLTKIRDLVEEHLIVQTANVMPGTGNRATFVVRSDRTDEGLTSIRGGRGVWRFTAECFESILLHAGFRVLEKHHHPVFEQGRLPWYCAVAEPADS